MITKRIINGRVVDLADMISDSWVSLYDEAPCRVCGETVQENHERCPNCRAPIDALTFPPKVTPPRSALN